MELKQIDWDALKRGTIPWSVDDCIEVMAWYENLFTVPKDDWDLKERKFSLKENESSEVRQFKFNQFQPVNQLGFYMVQRYGDLMCYHTYRFMSHLRCKDFFSNSQTELRGDCHVDRSLSLPAPWRAQ